MSRRLCATLVVLAVAATAPAPGASGHTAWAPVPAADLSKLRPADFADDELDLPYYLAHFHRVANSLVEEGQDRGFIGIPVWRSPQDNKPHNARIMEGILSLAFFYSTKRPWNPYYASAAVRPRLEAALDFWCRIQDPEGRFSEYAPGRWNLAATAFATKFMGETLRLLKTGPPIDAALLERVVAADRKAIRLVLTDPSFREHGKNFTNQYTNVWAGGLAFLALFPDPELRALLLRRIEEDSPVFQSPAGYFYEQRGADWGYNLGTHHSNLWMVWHYARGTALGPLVIEEERRFAEWLAYNAVPEPDGAGFTLNRGIETRQRRPFLDSLSLRRGQEHQGLRLIGAEVEQARAFLPTRDEVVRDRAERRAELERSWPRTAALEPGAFSAFSPYAFLHRAHGSWHPTDRERQAALNSLPSSKPPFLHQRMDSRQPVVFTYMRQPAYYAAFNSGERLTAQQRYGIGLVWHPLAGSVLQSQTATREAAWGTAAAEAADVYEAETLRAEFQRDDSPFAPQPGKRDLPPGQLRIRYPLADRGEKTLKFEEREIVVGVRHAGAFREQVPLLLSAADSLKVEPTSVSLTRGGTTVTVSFDEGALAETVETGLPVGPRRVVALVLRARERLTYRLGFSAR